MAKHCRRLRREVKLVGWGVFHANGTPYDLAHLDPFTMDITPKAEGAPSFRVLVSFGCHTFTRTLEANDPAHMQFIDGTDVRCFCPIRHGQSSHLPAMIRAASAGRAYFSHNRNFLLLEQVPRRECTLCCCVQHRARTREAARRHYVCR